MAKTGTYVQHWENIDTFSAVFGNILLTLLRIYNGIFVIFLKEWVRISTFLWLLPLGHFGHYGFGSRG